MALQMQHKACRVWLITRLDLTSVMPVGGNRNQNKQLEFTNRCCGIHNDWQRSPVLARSQLQKEMLVCKSSRQPDTEDVKNLNVKACELYLVNWSAIICPPSPFSWSLVQNHKRRLTKSQVPICWPSCLGDCVVVLNTFLIPSIANDNMRCSAVVRLQQQTGTSCQSDNTWFLYISTYSQYIALHMFWHISTWPLNYWAASDRSPTVIGNIAGSTANLHPTVVV